MSGTTAHREGGHRLRRRIRPAPPGGGGWRGHITRALCALRAAPDRGRPPLCGAADRPLCGAADRPLCGAADRP
eukprot:885840-Pyramimonas_sp.AAC.1